MARFLVALDGSPQAEVVLKYARDLAAKQGAELILFRAASLPVEVPQRALSLTPGDLGPELEKTAADELAQLAKRLEIRGKVTTALGQPWRAVCDAAKSTDADLVLIGSHGYDGWDRLLGTTAAKVVDHIDRPVLVVKAKPVA